MTPPHPAGAAEVLILSDRPFISATFAEQAAAQGLATSTSGLAHAVAPADPAVRRSTWIVVDVCGDPAAAVERCADLAAAAAHLVLLITCERSVSSADLARLLACRPAGVLGAGLAPSELVQALGMIQDGQLIVHVTRGGHTGEFLQVSLRRGAQIAAVPDFDRQERDLLCLVARGNSDDEIAQRLFVSEATVRRRVAALRKRTSTTGRVELAAWAGARGYYEQDAEPAVEVTGVETGMDVEVTGAEAGLSATRRPRRSVRTRAFALVSAPGISDALAATTPLLSA